MTQATLLVIHGVEQGQRFDLGEAPVGIGRGGQNDIRLLDTEASRIHARIAWEQDHFTLQDLGSSNGTYLNGHSIRQTALKSGDQIQIGRTALLFNLVSPKLERIDLTEKIQLTHQQDHDDRSNIVGAGIASDGHELLPPPSLSPEQAQAQTVANLQVLYRITEEAVRPSIPIEQTLQRILDLTLEAVGADRGCILLKENATDNIAPRVYSPLRDTNESPLRISRTIVDYVLRTKQGVRTTDAQSDTRFSGGQSILQGNIREAMCVPLQGRYELTGVMYVDITTTSEEVLLRNGMSQRFQEELLRLMVAIGRQAALAVEDHQYQQALVKAERLGAIGQTIATLSHHIKNILQGVRGGSYLIEMGLQGHNEDIVRKGWKIVEKNQNKIYHLVMDMLTYSKERQPVTQMADINETVHDVVELAQARAEESQIELALNLTNDLPKSLFDMEGIHRAVLNVVTNALDAVEGHSNPRIIISTGFIPESRLVFVSVEDNGGGIAPEQLPKLFQIFESTKGLRGTGLGLAVSQKILREHGGEILVESHPGQGAKFTLVWPLITEEAMSDGPTLA